MLACDVVDEFLDEDGFPHARAAEEADFAAFDERRHEVDGFNARLEYFRFRALAGEMRRVLMDGQARDILVHRFLAVDGLAHDIEHPAENRFSHGNGNGLARVHRLRLACKSRGIAHCDTTGAIKSQMLNDFEDERRALVLDLERMLDRRKAFIETHVYDGADDLNYSSCTHTLKRLYPLSKKFLADKKSGFGSLSSSNHCHTSSNLSGSIRRGSPDFQSATRFKVM